MSAADEASGNGNGNGGSIRITLRDVYEMTTEIKETVDLLNLRAGSSEQTRDDHEQRLRTVERKVWALPSIATILAVCALGVSILGVTVTSFKSSSPAQKSSTTQTAQAATPTTLPATSGNSVSAPASTSATPTTISVPASTSPSLVSQLNSILAPLGVIVSTLPVVK